MFTLGFQIVIGYLRKMRFLLLLILFISYSISPKQVDAFGISINDPYQTEDSQKPFESSDDLKNNNTPTNLILFQQKNNYTFPRTNGLLLSNNFLQEFRTHSSEKIEPTVNSSSCYWKKIRLRLIYPKHYFF